MDERLDKLAELAEAGLSAAGLVHEARQPLFAMKAMAQLAQRDGLRPESVDELLGLIAHLETLLDAWTDVGRREAPRLFDAREVAEQVQRMLFGRLQEAGAVLTFEPGPPVWAHGSPSMPRQVLVNLIQNAADAVCGSTQQDVRLQVNRTDVGFEYVVTDTGSGIPPEMKDRLFEAFATTKVVGKGTGLGLYVAQRLCAEAGGSLAIESLATGTCAVAQFAWSEVGPKKKAK